MDITAHCASESVKMRILAFKMCSASYEGYAANELFDSVSAISGSEFLGAVRQTLYACIADVAMNAPTKNAPSPRRTIVGRSISEVRLLWSAILTVLGV
jgi:hypothetical protein